MTYQKISWSDYRDVPAEKVAEINNAIDEYNRLYPKVDKFRRQYQKESDRQGKIFKIIWAIVSIIMLIILLASSSSITFATVGWSVIFGFIAAGTYAYFSKNVDVSTDSQSLNSLSSKITYFQKNVEAQRLKNDMSYWTNMSGHEFERQVTKLYSLQGYSALTTRGSGDGGVDIYLRDRNGAKYAIQCKNHKNPIGPAAIRDLYGAMTHDGIKNGIFIASGGYTTGAKEFANGKMQLLDINDVMHMHRTYSGRTY